MNNNGLSLAASLFFLFFHIALFSSGNDCIAQTNPGELTALEKLEGKIEVRRDDKNQAIVATQYLGRIAENLIVPESGVIIETEKNLKDLLSRYSYALPSVDFEDNIVVYFHTSHNQSVRLTVQIIGFKEGKLAGVGDTERLQGGAEKEGKRAFNLLVLPRSALK